MILGVVIGCLSSVAGIWLYFEVEYRRNKKKIWKGKL
jgi:hypothetical protein